MLAARISHYNQHYPRPDYELLIMNFFLIADAFSDFNINKRC